MTRRGMTNEEYQDRLDNIFGREFVLIGDYTNKRIPVTLQHTCCSYEFSINPAAALAYKGKYSFCPNCRSMIRAEIKNSGEKLWKHRTSTRVRRNKYDTVRYKSKVAELCSDEYSVLGEYVKSNRKIHMRHNVCGHEWDVIAGAFISKNGTRCPKCNNRGVTCNTELYSCRVAELVGDEYAVLGEYVKNDVPILMRHNICGHEWFIRPEFFTQRGTRCPKCNRGPVGLDAAIKRIEAFNPGRFDIIEYTVSSEPIKILDRKCAHEYVVGNLNSLTRNTRCPICVQGKIALKKQSVFEKRKDIEQHNQNMVFNWENGLTAKIACKKCEKTVSKKCLIGITYKCTECNKNKKNRSFVKSNDIKAAAQYIKTATNSDYITIIPGKTRKTNTIFRHNSCGTIFVKKFQNAFTMIVDNKHPCPKCGNKKAVAKTNEEFQADLDTKHGADVYTVIGQYKNERDPVLIRHHCGNKYEVAPRTLLASDRLTSKCPACVSLGLSIGEQKIKEVLDSLNIEYEQQYKLNGCKKTYHLRFDFAVFSSGKLILLIEFDGEQHFDAVKYFGGETGFKSRQESDKIKNNYCKANNIPLLRIPYTELNNIENIICTRLTA